MNKIVILLVIAAIVIYIITKYNTVKTTRSTKLDELLSNKWNSMFKNAPNKVGISAYVISDVGEFFGSSVKESQPTWIFRGGSTTKVYTAASVMLLYQRKMLNIDDLITSNIPGTNNPYIPNTPSFDIPNKSSITIRNLLEMKSGVFDITNDEVPKTVKAPYSGLRYTQWVEDSKGSTHNYTFEEMIGVVAKHKLSYGPPGGPYHYTNTGYQLLAVIIERVTGITLNNFMKKEFIVPLGLKNTTFPDVGSDQTLKDPYFLGITKFKGEYIETTTRNVSMDMSEGNVITTLPDVAKWTRLLSTGNTSLDKSYVNKMAECAITGEIHKNYGLGITCNPAVLGFGHDGNVMGYFTLARHNPITNITTVLMCTLFDADEPLKELEWFNITAMEVHELASNGLL